MTAVNYWIIRTKQEDDGGEGIKNGARVRHRSHLGRREEGRDQLRQCSVHR